MIRKLMNLSMIALLIGTIAFVASAQNRGGNGPNGNSVNVVTLAGTVESVNLRLGQGCPSFTLLKTDGRTVTILTGPYYILMENRFAINIGDRMSVQAFESLRFENTYVAVELNNLTTGATLILRDRDGRPRWNNGPGKPGRGCGVRQPIGNPANVVMLEGVIDSVSIGIGQGHPSFTLALADSRTVAVLAGPYYFLLENDFEINVGDRMEVRAFPSLRFADTYVAVELKNLGTGAVLTLRDENGVPVWSRGPGRGPRF